MTALNRTPIFGLHVANGTKMDPLTRCVVTSHACRGGGKLFGEVRGKRHPPAFVADMPFRPPSTDKR